MPCGSKRKTPKLTQADIKKLVKNPNTPEGLKTYWKKKLRK